MEITGTHKRTDIDGLYAIGDIVMDLSQINVGIGQSIVATTNIHEELKRVFDNI